MKMRDHMAIGSAVVGLIALTVAAQPASALAPFPIRARDYRVWMVRAFDDCNPTTVSVVGTGNPTGGCYAATTTTDDSVIPGASMRYARLIVRRYPAGVGGQGRITLFGAGFSPGQRVHVRLTLRTTRAGVVTKHPPASSTVTFATTTVDCGNQFAGCLVATNGGNIAASQTLTSCLGANSGLAKGNVAIVAAALVNCDTGKTFAETGILD